MSIASIAISVDVLEQLDLARWNALSVSQRQEIGQSVTEQAHAQGYLFTNLQVYQYGPDQTQPILEWRDEVAGCVFVLVPGGTFAPGYDDEQLARYARIHQRIHAWNESDPWNADAWNREDGDEDDEPGDAQDQENDPHDPPDRTRIFASVSPCDLRRKASVSIGPFLMASLPVPASAPGLPEIVTYPDWWRKSWAEMTQAQEALLLRWPQVAPVLQHYRWSLPTSAEYEWALRGGVDGLFYWGDELPAFVLNECAVPEATNAEWERANRSPAVAFEDIMRLTVEPERARSWPYGNRFGLAGMVTWGQWCAPDANPADAPLVVRGGASACYPWQMCGEWKSLLTAAEGRMREETTYAQWNALRPIVRLQAPSQ
jgi:hypothetical protein